MSSTRVQSLARIVDAQPISYPETLPISARVDELSAAITEHQVIIVAGETGSGKSTQLPKICLAAGRGIDGLIGHTQPRRVAARTVAERVADELGTTIGDGVGYTVRFNDQITDSTLLRVMTDGILLNELQRDRDLTRYDTIIVDEAHERSLNIDFLLGYLKNLLPRRPDLRIIVTSATIDTDRFAEHFAASDGTPAPIFIVEGRTYPVETRYRPFGPDNDTDPGDRRDQVRAVVDAVGELCDEGPGDILVFLSGEREIHDTADAIRRETTLERERLEILPLYARLPAHEQHKVFQPHRGRRVVLSTNVAETSITVPGVRYVVDVGTARISRYSKRLKVQRLPIEEVSQASANQRAGRCGRVAPGICIRLYTEENFTERAEFTDPEILRTNLASVILQMTAIGLGDVGRFPFVEPPDSATIRDGYLLLDELGALKEGRIGAPRKLTKTGRQIARLPIDPRLARMVIEADRYGCVREVLVIASALSIQDVRERSKEHPEKAAEMHRRFRVEGSDLLSTVALWDYLREQQKELSGNRFRRMCHDEFLHYVRVREWRDLYSQLRQVAGQLGIRPTLDEAHPDHVHRSVLAGHLSHLGVRDDDGAEFRGARDSRFMIAKGSALTKRPPRWVMATELVETNRLWARRCVAVDPAWIEPLADHLVKRSYGEPWWDANGGRAVIPETVTLFGLPIVASRTIGLDKVDRRLAREMFIRFALIDRQLDNHALDHDFVTHNDRFVARVSLLEARVRRTDLIDDESIYEFFDEALPVDITSTRQFDRWWRDAKSETPERLNFTKSILSNRSGIRLADYPDRWHGYPLTYRFAPDTPLDGATIEVPLTALNQIDPTGFDWSVPGYRRELVGLLLRSLPKDIRRDLIPMTDTADAAYARLGEPEPGVRIVDALAVALSEVTNRPIDASDFAPERLPSFLRFHLVVVDEDGNVVDAGDDLDAIRERQAGEARGAIARAAPVAERADITTWDLGTLDQVVEHTVDGGHVVRAYPTLLDRGSSVSLRVVDNEPLQRRAMRGGVRRLLLMAAAPTPTKIKRLLDQHTKLSLMANPIALDDLIDECTEAAVDAVLARHELPWNDNDFASIEADVKTDAPQLAADALAVVGDITMAADRVETRLKVLIAPALTETVTDVRAHLARLVTPGYVTRFGLDRLPDIIRYVRGIEYRLDHLGGDVGRDQRRMAEVRPLEHAYSQAVARMSRVEPDVQAVAFLLEEFRMSIFAQPEGVRGPISAKRIRRDFRCAAGRALD